MIKTSLAQLPSKSHGVFVGSSVRISTARLFSELRPDAGADAPIGAVRIAGGAGRQSNLAGRIAEFDL